MKKYLLLFVSLSLLCCLSCVSQKKEIKAKSTIKFERDNTNISKLIYTKGFYYNPINHNSDNVLFFEDGTTIMFYPKKQVYENEGTVKLFDYAEPFKDTGQIIGRRGVYTIKNDTIITYMYVRPFLLTSWEFEEERFKIINKKTIQRIYIKGLLDVADKYYRESGKSPWVDGDLMSFIAVDSLPIFENWLKKEKWMWRNESDWKDYMQHVEQIKKQYKKK